MAIKTCIKTMQCKKMLLTENVVAGMYGMYIVLIASIWAALRNGMSLFVNPAEMYRNKTGKMCQ